MIRITAYPTVEWLNTRTLVNLSGDRLASPGDFSALRSDISSRLSRWSQRRTRVFHSTWISTPNGEEFVDLVVEHGGRRVAYRFSSRYERDLEQSDALTLVYGKFDALYRVRVLNNRINDADLAFLAVSMNPSWFSGEGRLRAGRVASNAALHSVENLKRFGTALLPGFSVLRIRISRAGEWVHDFEQALGPPDFRTYVTNNLSRKSNRPSRKLTRVLLGRGAVQK